MSKEKATLSSGNIITGIIGIVIIIVLCSFFSDPDFISKVLKPSKITEGTIYDKEIIDAGIDGSGYSRVYIPITYRFYVQNDLKINGTVYEKTACFDVSEDTYYEYSIGDWFDSQNPRKIENEEFESGEKGTPAHLLEKDGKYFCPQCQTEIILQP